jgi:arylsulfatase A
MILRFIFAMSAFLLSTHLAAAEPPPNVILFLTDDLGNGDLGCYGNTVIQTPNIDAFAKQGTRLTQCYAASAVCSPSRSALLTGRTPHRNGVYTWIAPGSEVHLRTSEITLPKLLKEHGYTTCHVGKWHLNGKFNDPSQPQPNDHGYDYWMATQNNAAPSHKDPTNFVRNGKPVGKLEGFSAELVVDEALKWLTDVRDKSKPFFLAVWTHEPHLPIETDPKFQKLYEKIDEPDVRQHHGNVTQIDDAFGRLMKFLDDNKLTENTVVFVNSDNGPEGPAKLTGRNRGSTGGLRGRKRSMYEGGLRVPGIVRYPKLIKPGQVCDTPINGTDFFPTILRVVNVKPPADRVIDGVDVFDLWAGNAKSVERPKPLYWRLNMAPAAENLHMAMREGDWKLLASQDFRHFELYNLKDDPKETTDLKDKETERFEQMRKALQAHNEEIEKEGPDWWKRLNPDGGRPLTKKEKK